MSLVERMRELFARFEQSGQRAVLLRARRVEFRRRGGAKMTRDRRREHRLGRDSQNADGHLAGE